MLQRRRRSIYLAALALAACPGGLWADELEMRTGIPSAQYIPPYSTPERAAALHKVWGPRAPSHIDDAFSLTPNNPYAKDGSHLSFWKPSYVLGTAFGGEAGVNFWGIHDQGHINVGLSASKSERVLDCRIVSTGPIAFKTYGGTASEPTKQGRIDLRDGHALLRLPPETAPVSVELWPAPEDTPLGFFGCEIARIE